MTMWLVAIAILVFRGSAALVLVASRRWVMP
jgi:hypothetical protein